MAMILSRARSSNEDITALSPCKRVYPWYSSYQFAGNMPIAAIDIDGLEPLVLVDSKGKVTEPVIALLNAAFDFDKDVMRAITVKREFMGESNRVSAYVSDMKVMHTNASKQTKFKTHEWLGIIGHELTHVDQYDKSISVVTSNITYEIDKFFNGYLGTKDEKEAYDKQADIELVALHHDVHGILYDKNS